LFSDEQKKYLKRLGLKIDFSNVLDDDLLKIEEAVSDRLEMYGFDEKYDVTQEGAICESILDLLS